MRRMSQTNKTAASEIEYEELPKDRKELIKKVFNVKPYAVFDGIHGYIVEIPKNTANRLTESELKKLISDKNFRWLEPNAKGGMSVGF